MGYAEVMALPISVFWELSGQVERLRRDEAKLQLEVLMAVQSVEGAQVMLDQLDKFAPHPVEIDPEGQAMADAVRDEAGFAELRNMAGG